LPSNGGRPQAGFKSVDAKNAKLRRKNAKLRRKNVKLYEEEIVAARFPGL